MNNLIYDFVEGSAQKHTLFKHIQGNEHAITLKNQIGPINRPVFFPGLINGPV